MSKEMIVDAVQLLLNHRDFYQRNEEFEGRQWSAGDFARFSTRTSLNIPECYRHTYSEYGQMSPRWGENFQTKFNWFWVAWPNGNRTKHYCSRLFDPVQTVLNLHGAFVDPQFTDPPVFPEPMINIGSADDNYSDLWVSGVNPQDTSIYFFGSPTVNDTWGEQYDRKFVKLADNLLDFANMLRAKSEL